MERLFASFKDEKRNPSAMYDPESPESYESYLQSMFEDSTDYETAILSGDRSEAALYYAGLEPSMDYTDVSGPYRGEDPNQTLGELLDQDKKNRPNRSTFVSTDVKDAIMLMLPSLVRLFGASENPVNLVPRSEADSDMAEQATSYVNYVFWNDNPGFLNLYGAIKDALTVRTGFLKWWSEDEKEVQSASGSPIFLLSSCRCYWRKTRLPKSSKREMPIEQPAPPPIYGCAATCATATWCAGCGRGLSLPLRFNLARLDLKRQDRWLVRRREARRQLVVSPPVRTQWELHLLRRELRYRGH